MARLPVYDINNIVCKRIDRDPASITFGRHRLSMEKIICSNCNAIMFTEEKIKGSENLFSLCCAKKKFKLPPMPTYPPFLLNLIKQQNENGRGFMEKIRSYNSIFAFTSFNAKVINIKLL